MRPVFAVLAALIAVAILPSSAGAVRGWRPPTTLSNGYSFGVSGDAAPDGRVAAAWSQLGTVRGTVKPGLEPVTLDTGGTQTAVGVAAGTGEVVFAWVHRDESGPGGTARVTVWSPQTGLGPVADVGRTFDDGFTVPSAAVAPDGRAVVAFGDVVASRPAGGTFEGEPLPGAGAWSVDVAVGGDRTVLIAAGRYGDVTASTRTGAGPWTTTPLDGVGEYPSVAVATDAQGRAAALWSATDGGLHAARSVAGDVWTPLPGVPTGQRARFVALGSSPSGQAVAAWTQPEEAGRNGGLQGVTFDVATGPAVDAALPQPSDGVLMMGAVLMGRDGSAIVAWKDGHARLVATRRDVTGAFDPVQVLRCPGENEYPVGGAIDDGGTAHLIAAHYDARDQAASLFEDAAGIAPSGPTCPEPAGPSYPSGGGPWPSGGPVSVGGFPPGMRVAGRQRLRTVLRKGLRLAVDVPQAGSPQFALVVPKRQARKLRIGRKATTIGRRTVALQAGRNTVAVKVAKRLRRKLAKARRLTVQVRVTTAAGGLILQTQATLRR